MFLGIFPSAVCCWTCLSRTCRLDLVAGRARLSWPESGVQIRRRPGDAAEATAFATLAQQKRAAGQNCRLNRNGNRTIALLFWWRVALLAQKTVYRHQEIRIFAVLSRCSLSMSAAAEWPGEECDSHVASVCSHN